MLPRYLLIFSDIIYPAPASLSPWWQSNRTFRREQHKTNQTATWQLTTCDENGFLFSFQTCTQPCLSVAVNSQSPLSELQWHRCRGETICCCCPPAAPINRPMPMHTFTDSRGNLETTDPNSDTVQHNYWCQSLATMWFPRATSGINEPYQLPGDSLWLKTKMTSLKLYIYITRFFFLFFFTI